MTSRRAAVISELRMLASASAQLEYEKSLTNAGHAPTELIAAFCDDLFQPRDLVESEEFTEAEIKDLAHLYGLMVEVSPHSTVSNMLKDPAWRKVLALAKDLSARIT